MRRKVQVLAVVIAGSAVLAGVAVAASSPSVVTGDATNRHQTSVTLHGTVNPNGSSTTYFFQWGPTNGYGDTGRTFSAGSGTTARAVADSIGGLTPGTTYHYRLVATNQNGTSTGADRTFTTTGPPPPGVTTGPATQLSSTGATLTGTVNPSHAITTYWFNWGTTTAYGQNTFKQPLSSTTQPQNVASSLQGLLAPGTIYHYQLVASHSGSATSYGADGNFMTYPSRRPIPKIYARVRPKRARTAPYTFTTTGSVGPTWIPPQYACNGNVTIRFFRGIKQVGFTMAGVQPNCTFGAQSVFTKLPRHSQPPVHLRVVIRFISTPYLAGNRAKYQHVTLG
jgi:hypothetical protein